MMRIMKLREPLPGKAAPARPRLVQRSGFRGQTANRRSRLAYSAIRTLERGLSKSGHGSARTPVPL